jgi:hypothetical protein
MENLGVGLGLRLGLRGVGVMMSLGGPAWYRYDLPYLTTLHLASSQLLADPMVTQGLANRKANLSFLVTKIVNSPYEWQTLIRCIVGGQGGA